MGAGRLSRTGVIVMAYGTPADLGDVERYYTDIRHGRTPPPELLEELTQRYRAIGGRSPLLEITRAQVKGIEERLGGPPAFLGQKHSPPFVGDAIEALAQNDVTDAAGLVLAPHYSAMSVGDYERRARLAAESVGWKGNLKMVESWHLEPGYVEFLIDALDQAVSELPEDVRGDAMVVFSAHSLPERILQKNDPYPDQLRETAQAVASRIELDRWRVGWQSAGRTADPWLGPDILEIIGSEAEAGTPAIIVCPCGFVSDHLEVLYDLDIEAAGLARSKGIAFGRTRSPNDDPSFLDTLAAVVRRALDANI